MNRWFLGVVLALAGGCHLVFPFELKRDTAVVQDLADGRDLADGPSSTDQGTDLPPPDAPALHDSVAIDVGGSVDTGQPCSSTSSWQEDQNLKVSCTYSCGGATLQCLDTGNTCSCSNPKWSKGDCADPGGSYQLGVPCIKALDNGCCKPP